MTPPRAMTDPGLCASCGHAAVIRSDRGSVFLQCRLGLSDPSFPKYPRLPVLICKGWRRAGEPESTPDGAR
jgi:hypothetical protein